MTRETTSGNGPHQIKKDNTANAETWVRSESSQKRRNSGRANHTCHMKPSEQKPSSSGPASGTWTLVDEGGEEVTVVSVASVLLGHVELCASLKSLAP